MKAIRYKEFQNAVGQAFIDRKTEKFPNQGWSVKVIGNVVYVWAKRSTPLLDIAKIEATSGKMVRLCIQGYNHDATG